MFTFPNFKNIDPALDTVLAVKAYLQVNGRCRKYLLARIGNRQSIQAETIANDCKKAMAAAGVPSKFKAHSIKMASASKLLDLGFTVDEVMILGGWSSVRVFMDFYNRRKIHNASQLMTDNLQQEVDDMQVEESLLNSDEIL